VHHPGRVGQHRDGDRNVDLVLGKAPVHRGTAHKKDTIDGSMLLLQKTALAMRWMSRSPVDPG